MRRQPLRIDPAIGTRVRRLQMRQGCACERCEMIYNTTPPGRRFLFGMPKHDIVVVGTSTGGVDALQQFVHGLPADFPGTIFIVMHIGAESAMPEILSRCSRMKVLSAKDGVRYQPGEIHIAPPHRHMLISDGLIKLNAGPRENGYRPAIDPLFRSAAREHRSRVAGIILTGALDDGTAGLFAVKSRGGVAIVQDPAEAIAPNMPLSALRQVEVDHCCPLAEIAPLLVRLATQEEEAKEINSNREAMSGKNDEIKKEPPPAKTQISLACPECNGPLYETKAGEIAHFECNVGHAFSPESLTEAHAEALERALWTALRTLNERVTLHRQLLRRQRNKGEEQLFQRFEDSVRSAERDIELLREVIGRI
jgi:two-component system chemotaxis response regulator CheB